MPAHLVQRVCGTGIEVIIQAADSVAQSRADLALGVGTESMTRSPVSAYTHRGGFRLGGVDFRDTLWESLHDTAFGGTMGDTAETVARQYKLTRPEVNAFAAPESNYVTGEVLLASGGFVI